MPMAYFWICQKWNAALYALQHQPDTGLIKNQPAHRKLEARHPYSGGTWPKQWKGYREIVVGFHRVPQAQQNSQYGKQQPLYRKNGNSTVGFMSSSEAPAKPIAVGGKPTDREQEEVIVVGDGNNAHYWAEGGRHITDWTILVHSKLGRKARISQIRTTMLQNMHVVQALPCRGKIFWQENLQRPSRARTPLISASNTGHDQKTKRTTNLDTDDSKEQDGEPSPRCNIIAATHIDPPSQVESKSRLGATCKGCSVFKLAGVKASWCKRFLV